ncbi:Neutral alpha-glucosidase AB [Tritrichomonas foetus]|uniref:Glucosidase II subunit alpha n=1 Tax=Tritrichomonas foetus TaxID=1144522 RepID=A0A1J4JPF9_9EUKA|nr:Neutral alpha-glucosidase AB [Tritrichomonas foetus]|eukprot:OHT00915.1 Neutral alpha-glucosidase AB [Tritrichomonas foetus]
MFSFFITFLVAYNQTNYRQCKDSPFCARNRFVEGQNWESDPSQSQLSNSVFTLPLVDPTYNKKLSLRLTFHENNFIHFKISPAESESFERFDCSSEPSVVNQTILEHPNEVQQNQNDTHIQLTSGKMSAVIQIKPFTLTILENDVQKVTVNSDLKSIFESNLNENDHPNHFAKANFQKYKETLKNGPASVAMTFLFHDEELKFAGLPSHSLSTALPSTVLDDKAVSEPLRLFNNDANEFEANSVAALYGSIPYLVGYSNGASTSVFWCNPSETWVDIDNEKRTARFVSETGYIDCFVFSGTHSEVTQSYAALTGRPPLPQIFSLGFHQSRWSYMNTKEVRLVQKHLDINMIPHDSIWLDIDHTDNKKYFTFDPKNFKDVRKLAKDLAKNNRYLVAIVDPHLKVERDYQVYYEAKDGSYFIKGKNKRDYIAKSWPGRSGFVDFLNPEASEWWANNYGYNTHRSASPNMFIWNDMNEPAVMNEPESTCPRDCIHFNGFENRDVHNIYGHMMSRSSFEGVLKRNPDQEERPFVLTRSYFAGTQKYAFMWTGDNTADWDHLRNSISMTLTLGISGFPYSGSDVGGFFNSPDHDLLLRWYQVGAYCYPFFRTHCHHKSDHREPYVLKGDYLNGVKAAIQERYQLLPLWYTQAYLTSLTGEPIVRPLWYEFAETEASEIENQVMIGDSLLIIPFLSQEEEDLQAYMPRARWYEYRTLSEVGKSGELLTIRFDRINVPVFVRGGKIVCTKPKVRKSAIATINDPFSMIVALDNEQKASGVVYVDDGHTYNYTANGAKIFRSFHFDGTKLTSREIEQSNHDSDFIKDYSAQIDLIQIACLEKIPSVVKNQNGDEVEMTNADGVLQLFVSLGMKDDWELTFEY